MRVCLKCHRSFGCPSEHLKVAVDATPCGVCSRPETETDCYSPLANEINSYNLAVRSFVLSMRRKFLENVGKKGGWQTISYDYAFSRLLQEAGELSIPLAQFAKSTSVHEKIIDESADIANFAVFIASRAAGDEATDRGIQKLADEAIKKVAEAKQ